MAMRAMVVGEIMPDEQQKIINMARDAAQKELGA